MARQTGPVFLQGLYGNACFYYAQGEWRVRQKSTLTGKRVKTSKRFALTMVYAGLMGRSSTIASVIYKALPVHWKQFWMYRAFVGEAMDMLKEGKTDAEAQEILWQRYLAEFEAGYKEEAGFEHVDEQHTEGVLPLPKPLCERYGWRFYAYAGKVVALRKRSACYEELRE